MSNNTKIALIVGLILALCLSLILYQKLNWVEETVTIPPSVKVTSNPYYTAEQLLVKSGYKAERIDDALTLAKLPKESTLILFNSDLLKEPIQKIKIRNWVKAGGHLILSPQEDGDSIRLQELFDIYIDDEESDDDDEEPSEPSNTGKKANDESDSRGYLAIEFEQDTCWLMSIIPSASTSIVT